MKVLFAVSNENESEAIVKKYQKDYKEIISYKNVYYFNAIIKEIQRDKSYDRIVISEDLEPFANNNYDTIDKFLFEKLDNISDEAADNGEKDAQIILICSDRRSKSDGLLVKLFGIGIYSAIVGKDRSVEEVCRLINNPRTKKEAKLYYRIDSDEVNYKTENDTDVNENEIQSIIRHYKSLGKNEEKYVESFNNIASQYTDAQLRIIIKFLPINVKAILEARSAKYQQVVMFGNNQYKTRNTSNIGVEYKPKQKTQKKATAISESDLKIEAIEKRVSNPLTGKPIVIPSAVKQEKTVEVERQLQRLEERTNSPESNQKIVKKQIQEIPKEQEEKQIKQVEQVQQTQETPKRGRGRPKKIQPIVEPTIQEVQTEKPVKRGRGRPKKAQESTSFLGLMDKQENEEIENFALPVIEETVLSKVKEETILPGFEDEEEKAFPGFEDEGETALPGFEDEEEAALPGFEDEEETALPGFENEEETALPGFENENVTTLPGVEDRIIKNNVQSYRDDFRQENNEYSQSRQIERRAPYYGSQFDNEFNNLLTGDKKVVAFVGTTKNGTSFMVNNLAALFSSMGINTAILDTTENRNSYFIYTKNEESLRKIAYNSIPKLKQGVAEGIKVDKNLSVYTSLPGEGEEERENITSILKTLISHHTLVLIDSDFNTPIEYFDKAQEIYLVQSMDILTIQPLTSFMRDLKNKGILKQEKLRIVINKVAKIRGLNENVLIGGMAYYNSPSMTFMTELFNKDTIKFCEIPLDINTYIAYLEAMVSCNISINKYPKTFMMQLKQLASMVYPLLNKTTYKPFETKQKKKTQQVTRSHFSPNMNSTLEQMNRMKNGY